MGINPFQLVRFMHKGSKNISAIIRIYRPQFKIYQRLLEYIDLPTKLTTIATNKEGVPKFWHTLFI